MKTIDEFEKELDISLESLTNDEYSEEGNSIKFTFTGVTVNGLSKKLDPILDKHDDMMKKKNLTPLTMELIDKYGSKKKVLEKMCKYFSGLTKDFNYVPLISEVLKLFKALKKLIKSSNDYEIYKDRILHVHRDHNKVIQKVYALYVKDKDLEKEDKLGFKKILIMHQ